MATFETILQSIEGSEHAMLKMPEVFVHSLFQAFDAVIEGRTCWRIPTEKLIVGSQNRVEQAHPNLAIVCGNPHSSVKIAAVNHGQVDLKPTELGDHV